MPKRPSTPIAHGSPFLAGYLFLHAGQAAGYALLMKTWSQEAGGLVVWLDELYIAPAFQGHGLGSAFLRALPDLFPNAARLPPGGDALQPGRPEPLQPDGLRAPGL